MGEEEFKSRIKGGIVILITLALLIVGYWIIPILASMLSHIIQKVIFWTGLIEMIVLIAIAVAIARDPSAMLKSTMAFFTGYFIMLISYHIVLPLADIMLNAMSITQHVQIIHVFLILIWVFLMLIMPIYFIVQAKEKEVQE